MAPTNDLPSGEATGYNIVDTILSNDGKTLYFYKMALDGDVHRKEVVCEQWEVMSTTPELVQCTTFHISTAVWDTKVQLGKMKTPKLQLVPSKPISASPNWSDLLHSIQLRHRDPLASRSEADAQDDWSRLLAEYWGCMSQRERFIIICRRKRLRSPSDDYPVSKKRNVGNAKLSRRMFRIRSQKLEAYDDELKFNEVGLEGSSRANVFVPESEAFASDEDSSLSDSESSQWSSPGKFIIFKRQSIPSSGDASLSDSGSSQGPSEIDESRSMGGAEAPGDDLSLSLSDSASSKRGRSDSEQVSEMEDIQSLSENESIGSASNNSWETLPSFGSTISSSSSRVPTVSAERLQTSEFLRCSGNARHYHEIIAQHQSKQCDQCKRSIVHWLHCFQCENSDYDVCLSCIDKGQWCLDKSHEMLEADGEGPIAMRRFSDWVFTNEIRVYDLKDDGTRDCVFEFSSEREDLLHESQPSLHPSAPVFVWPMSPKKLLLASFSGDKERVVKRMKPFVKRGRKIDVQVRFSDSGSNIYVASIEAVKIRGNAPEAYNLHMQVAVLQLRFDGQSLIQPIALCERHHELRVILPSTLGSLPFVWTWNSTEVCLTLTTDCISLWRVKFNRSEFGRLHLEPIDVSTAHLPLQYQGKSSKAQFIFTDEDNVPVVALAPSHLQRQPEFPSICSIKAESPWSACDNENSTTRADAEVSAATSIGLQDNRVSDLYYIKPASASSDIVTTQLSQIRSEIRLLCLLPGRTNDALRCTLAKVSLDHLEISKSKFVERFSFSKEYDKERDRHQDNAPTFTTWLHPKYKYEALSYAWGKSLGNHIITVDGEKDVPITDNLYAALRRLRRLDRQRLLWVDAVCIDLKNLEERSSQVQMMGRIYSTAAKVVIWLGDAEVPSPIFNHELSDERDGELSKNGDCSAGGTKFEGPSQWERKTLSRVLESAWPPWWTRAWVTQELVVAENINVAFGAAEVDWYTFKHKFRDIWSSISEFKQLIELRQNKRTWHCKGGIGETARLTRHTDATDPRDKVYSLMSLVKPAQASLVRPNYHLEAAEVFTLATYADLRDNVSGNGTSKESPANFDKEDNYHPQILRYTASSINNKTGPRPDKFRILNWAKSSAPRRLPGMPSWALDFSDSSVLTGDAEFRHGFERWTFDGNDSLNQRAMLKLSEDNRQLTVHGAILGHIKDIVLECTVREYRDRPADELIARLLTLFSKLPSESPYKVVSGSQAKLRTDSLRATRGPNWYLKEDEPGTFTVEFEGSFTQVLPHWNPEAEHGAIDWTDLYSVALNRANCEVKGCRCGASQLFRCWDRCVGVPRHARNFSGMSQMNTSPWDEYCELMKADGPDDVSDPLQEEQSCFLFTTSPGFIGLGPESAGPGDVIALFYGSDIPVVLRPVGDHFVYRGRAWINGIMQGELWNIYEDPLLEERNFEIC